MSKTVSTNKGTTLPLMNLKGKDYMMVAHRIVWFNEEALELGGFEMQSEQLVLTDERAVIKATVKLFDKAGKLLKQGVGTKSETKKDFPDFIEKAETGAIGRAITMMGFGTAYALADLDEGSRIIDSPLAPVVAKDVAEAAVKAATQEREVKKSTFRKPSAPATPADSSGWEN